MSEPIGLTAARWYAAKLHWRVFPLKPRTKKPLIEEWQNQATDNLETIAGWWAQWPDANIGIATGRGSGIWVLDVDGEVGDESLFALREEFGDLPETVMSMTMRGHHRIFSYPVDCDIRNSTSKLAPKIDTRGEGGYIVAPPSVHPDGPTYGWEASSEPLKCPIAEAPSWLVERVKKHRKRSNGQADNGEASLKEMTKVCAALETIPADNYQTWIDIGMALHSTGWQVAFELFCQWSATCPEKYDETRCRNKWGTFETDGGINLGRIFYLAQNVGATSIVGCEPEPLRREIAPPEPYPIHALNPSLADATRRLMAVIQAPDALCAQSVLATASLAVQAHGNVLIDGRKRPLSGFFLTIGESGERKSAVDEIAFWPLRKLELALAAEYKAKAKEFEADNAAYDRAKLDALKAKGLEQKKAGIKNLDDPPEPPQEPTFLTEEPSYEGLVKMLARGRPSAGLFSDEGGRLIGGYAMNLENRLKTSAGLSGLWDGKRIDRVRGADGAALLFGRRVSMHLMVQPGVSQMLLSDPVLADQGLMSRLLTVYPESTCGMRPYVSSNLTKDRSVKTYHEKMTGICERSLSIDKETGGLAPKDLTLSPRAKRTWVTFHDAIEKELREGGQYEQIRGFANKAPEHCLRLAGVLHLWEKIDETEISFTHIEAAIELVKFYLSESLRLFNSSLSDSNLVLAEKLLAWIGAANLSYVYPRKVYQRGPNQLRDKANAKRTIKILEDHGWLIPLTGADALIEVDGARRKELWRVFKKS